MCELTKIKKIDESTKDDAALKEEEIAANCDSKLCSTCGFHFCECITNIYEIEKIRMLDISNECYFVGDNDNPDSNNKLCRFLLHWWFATNVCLITVK